MQPFRSVTSGVAPLPRSNVDTDQIIPAEFLKRIQRTGFHDVLFERWRKLPNGEPDPNFVINDPRFAGAQILATGPNFGCGSSREHAVWALKDHGFRVVIAPGFADIFHSNCFKNGLLPVVLDQPTVDHIVDASEKDADYRVTVDLEARVVQDVCGLSTSFVVDDFRRECLLKGWDDIDLTLQHIDAIVEFERR